ncbi:MAG: phosphatase PAP2 family protein, partial [Actinomycetota bacterium]|nr:phosphatase PAP2 family protein [Actinomycetota bacterium]
VVIVTGNHYLVDVAAGAVLMLASDALVTLASQALQRRRAAVAATAPTQPWPTVGQAAAASYPVPAVTGSLALDDARRPQHQLASILVAEPSDVRQACLPGQRR